MEDNAILAKLLVRFLGEQDNLTMAAVMPRRSTWAFVLCKGMLCKVLEAAVVLTITTQKLPINNWMDSQSLPCTLMVVMRLKLK